MWEVVSKFGLFQRILDFNIISYFDIVVGVNIVWNGEVAGDTSEGGIYDAEENVLAFLFCRRG